MASYLRTELPEGSAGPWSVERFEVANRPSRQGRPAWDRSPAGVYTRLRKHGQIYMTDLLEEWQSHQPVLQTARGRRGAAVVSGLGLGLVVEWLFALEDAEIGRITVLEADADVIGLVSPYLQGKYPGCVDVIHTDAFAWNPPTGARYVIGWHDIWPNTESPSVVAEMDQLERRFSPYCDWQACWARLRAEGLLNTAHQHSLNHPREEIIHG